MEISAEGKRWLKETTDPLPCKIQRPEEESLEKTNVYYVYVYVRVCTLSISSYQLPMSYQVTIKVTEHYTKENI